MDGKWTGATELNLELNLFLQKVKGMQTGVKVYYNLLVWTGMDEKELDWA